MAETPTVARVVGVLASAYEFSPIDRPVVGVRTQRRARALAVEVVDALALTVRVSP